MRPEISTRDQGTLLDIRIAGSRIAQFLDGVTLTAFVADVKSQSAVLHQILVIGEASRRLSPDFRGRHPEIPWLDISGMRNRLIHGYDDVDLELVWVTAQVHVPRLLADLAPLTPPRRSPD